jgi:hypothetical protein
MHAELLQDHLVLVSFKKNCLPEFKKIVRKIRKHVDPNAMAIIGSNALSK